jgi:hypothetical protein
LSPERDVRKVTVAALFLFAVLSLLLTYPLPLHLTGAVEDRQDALLNVWITAWDGHQLLADPLHLFDANIFAPYLRTLAYSELVLGNALLALPITAVTYNPVLGYNAALLLSFFLSGLGTYLLVLQLTRSSVAGMVAGTIFAFCSYRMSNLAQAQLLATQWMPFALLAWHQLMRRPRPRHVATLVLFFCLQMLSSFYYGILLALAILGLTILEFVLAIRALFLDRDASRIRHRASPIPHLLVTACCSLLIILPFALPYFQVQHELQFERSLSDSEPFSASLRQYVMVPVSSPVHSLWLPSDETPIAGGYPVDALFPGVAAVGLGVWGLARGRGRTRWFYFCLLLAAWCLSLGPRLYLAPGQPAGTDMALPYAWLYAIVPGFKALRAPARFDILVMLALAVLGGYGVASFKTLVSGSKSKYLLFVGGALSLVILESIVWLAAHAEPVPVGDEVPPVYRWLAREGQQASEGAYATILELPMAFTPGGPQLEYQYLSTYHWSTTPDGYSGFIPPKHGQIVYEMERFPSERSVSLLQALGVHYVVIHTGRYPAYRWLEMERALNRTQDLVPTMAFGTDRVYQVAPHAFDPSGLEVRAYLPPAATAGQPYTAYVIAINRGSRSYAVRPTDLLRPAAAWYLDGKLVEPSNAVADIPLVTSPEGGAAVIPLALTAPVEPGSYRLVIGEPLGSLGSWEAGGTIQVGDRSDEDFPVPAQLAGWSVPKVAHAGQLVQVDLTWRSLGKIDAYYSVYVKVVDAGGSAIAGWDGQPRDGVAPTLLWVPGETIGDTVTLSIPISAFPGAYTVEVGMYRAEDLARCLTLSAEGVPLERVVLGTVQVMP